MYHTAPPGRPGSERRSPVRLSRGFMPGGVLRFAIVHQAVRGNLPLPCLRRFPGPGLFEHKSIVVDVDRNPIALLEVSLQHAHREWVEDAPLEGPLQRPRAVCWIVALADDEALRFVGQFDMDLALLAALYQAAQLDV